MINVYIQTNDGKEIAYVDDDTNNCPKKEVEDD